MSPHPFNGSIAPFVDRLHPKEPILPPEATQSASTREMLRKGMNAGHINSAFLGQARSLPDVLRDNDKKRLSEARFAGLSVLMTSLENGRTLPHGDFTQIQQGLMGPGAGIQSLYSGRIVDIETPGISMAGGRSSNHETISILHMNLAPGEAERQRLVKVAQAEGRFSPFTHMTSAIGIFQLDPDAKHPRSDKREADDHEDYKNFGDWRFVDVVTNIDPNPLVKYVHYTLSSEVPEAVNGHIEEYEVLSELAKPRMAEDKEKYKKTYNAAVDAAIAAWDPIWKTLNNSQAGSRMSQDTDIIPMGRLSNNPMVNKAALDILKRFQRDIFDKDPFQMRVLKKAHEAYREVDEYKRQLKAAGRSFGPSEKASVATFKAAIRHEFMEALACADQEQVIADIDVAEELKTGEQRPIPMRWWATTISDSDKELLVAMKNNSFKTPLGDKMREAGMAYAPLTAPGMEFVLQPLPGNNVSYYCAKDTGQTSPLPGLAYGGKCATFDGTSGTYEKSTFGSLYDSTRQLQMDGIIGIVDCDGPEMEQGKRYLLVDLLKAPSKIFSVIASGGHFDGNNPYKLRGTQLADILYATPVPADLQTMGAVAINPKPKTYRDGMEYIGGVRSDDKDNKTGMEIFLKGDGKGPAMRLRQVRHSPLGKKYDLLKLPQHENQEKEISLFTIAFAGRAVFAWSQPVAMKGLNTYAMRSDQIPGLN